MSRWWWLLALAAFLPGCTTTSGKGFATSVHVGLSVPTQPQTPDPTPNSPPPNGLLFRVFPPKATIFFDGVPAGKGQALLDTSKIGEATVVTISALGFESQKFQILSKGQKAVVAVALDPLMGYLTLSPPEGANEDGWRVEVDGSPARLGLMALPVGPHKISWTKFGFYPGSAEVIVSQYLPFVVKLTLIPAEFRLRGLAVGAAGAFNPLLKGPEGKIRFRFAATAPGKASLTVTNSQGVVVYKADFTELDFVMEAAWNGRSEGQVQPKGTYTLVLNGAPEGEASRDWGRTTVNIDPTLTKYAENLLWAPTTDTLLPGSASSSFFLLSQRDVVGTSEGEQVPTKIDFSYGLLPGLTLRTAFGFQFWSQQNLNSAVFDLGLKYRLAKFPGGLSGAVEAGTSTSSLMSSGSSPSWEFWTPGPSVRGGLDLGWTTGPWRFFLAPEVDLSAASAPSWVAIGRLGLLLDLDPVTLGFSAALAANAPSQASAELRWRPLDTEPLWLGVVAGSRVWDLQDYAVYGGVFIGNRVDTLDLVSH